MGQVIVRRSDLRAVGRHVALAAAAAAGLLAMSCGKPREAKVVDPVVIRDVPDVLRGTIGAEASINGTQPQLVSGLGLVVNLNGTGGGELPPGVAATMEREMARNGIGRGSIAGGALEGMSPQELLRQPSVAVVIVEARIPPGAPEGATFDVAVRTLPGSSVTSLEGGTLWSTDLRLGPATTFGGYKTRRIAVARGPIFLNPFTEPAGPGELGVTRTVGRILGGGRVVDPLKLELVLDSDSHARARSVVAAINARYPRSAGEPGQTARGRGSEGVSAAEAAAGLGTIRPSGSRQSIAIAVPSQYRDTPADFLKLLQFTRIDPSFPEEYARRDVEALKSNPGLSEELGWCLKAIGKPAIPFLVPLYDYPEFVPRMTALEAGAFLGDARTTPHLIRLAQSGTPAIKAQAIRLMSKLPSNPQINMALRDLVNSPELDVRVAAWEGLSQRNDPLLSRIAVGPDKSSPKFILETVPAADPMVYVTQQGQPKIVVFGTLSGVRRGSGGGGVAINKPTLVTAWSDRFMLAADSPGTDLRVRYRNARTGRVITEKAPDTLTALIEYLAQQPTPEDPRPGLDFSYSEVVGAVYELSRQGGVSAVFATEQDKLRAEIFEAAQATALVDRPETTEPDDPEAPQAEALVFKPRSPTPLQGVGTPQPEGEWKPRIIPLTSPAPKPAARE